MLHTGAAQAGDASQARQHQHQHPHQQRPYHDRFDLTRAPSPGGDSILTVRIPGHQNRHQDDPGRRVSLLHDRGPSDSSQWSHTERHGHGLANLNRWSHSTASSVASIDTPPTAIKSQPHTNPSSHGFHTASIWARRNLPDTQMSPEDVSPRSIAYQRPQPMQSPEYHRRRVPRFEKPLPPRMSISNHSPNDEAQLTSATFTPTSAGLLTPNSYVNSDYFGSTASASSSYDKSPHALPPRTSSRQNGSISRQDTSPAESSSGRGRGQDKKTMLSKALEKANTAVLLDNAMNYEGALDAYRDACRLLENVLGRTSTPDDRRKLDAIRDTYTIRIDELLQIQLNTQATRRDKQLPPRPMSNESLVSDVSAPDRSSAIIETATLTRIIDAPPSTNASAVPSPIEGPPTSFLAVSPSHGPRTSFLTSAIQEVEGTSAPGAFLGPLWERERSRSPFRDSTISHETARPYNLEPALMPRPLTPRGYDEHENSFELDSRPTTAESQDVLQNTDPVSWLDTIDESGSSGSPSNTTTSTRSPSSSVHEHSPRRGVHRRDISAAVSHASLDFDAAFNAAVEAAYEDGYEVDDDFLVHHAPVQDNRISLEPDSSRPSESALGQYLTLDGQLDDDEAEEERILADITNDYIDHGFDFGIQSKSALPRQSDSSTYSGRTYQSSQVSNRTTAGTSLSTVAENVVSCHTPSSSLATDISKTSPEQTSGAQQTTTPSRRVTGPNFKQLKIETSRKPTLRSRGFTNTEPKEAADALDVEDEADADRRISEVPSLRRVEAALASPYHMRSAASDMATPMSLDSLPENGDGLNNSFRSPRPKLFRGRNKSSLSLRETGGFISEETDTAPASPMSAFPGGGEVPPFRRYITPPGGSISITRTDSASGGHHIFESFLNPPNQPPSPGADDSYSPSSLEPCPEPTLLRPFWMLRRIADVLNQSRGGFLTTRLFVPRQIWMNRSVKLKNVEDKISNCDLLTAALGKLSKVDTYDADAVLEGLQGFEEVMERVQAVLIKRLGSEVGVQGVSAIFKDAPVSIDSTGTTADAREPKPNKSYLSSWRKLRGKNSSGGVTVPLSSSRTDKEVANMASVPMTSFVSIDKRTAHKHTSPKETTTFEGPHREYMSSVSRLCEAAQVLDQVARQVEDPGLKHSSPTHIGLELSTRHAAEFFGFYICRFVLGDVTLLMDKYVKRSTEWVIA